MRSYLQTEYRYNVNRDGYHYVCRKAFLRYQKGPVVTLKANAKSYITVSLH